MAIHLDVPSMSTLHMSSNNISFSPRVNEEIVKGSTITQRITHISVESGFTESDYIIKEDDEDLLGLTPIMLQLHRDLPALTTCRSRNFSTILTVCV